jgi:dinuclear metal center YbgI/SA1388 family protein
MHTMPMIADILRKLEQYAPLSLQESYDNSGLITGERQVSCTGLLLCLDVTDAVLEEALSRKCNLIIAHHPLIFRALKTLTGKNDTEKILIKAIKNDISIYACHTNMDNVLDGVNGKIADLLGLQSRAILEHRSETLQKLIVYVPENHLLQVESALFGAGAGNIGKYSECSFVSEGVGSFKPGEDAVPFSGNSGIRSKEKEKKVEVIFPRYLNGNVIQALRKAHPYEEIAYEIYALLNDYQRFGSGIIGELAEPMEETAFLGLLKQVFQARCVRHSEMIGKKIKKVAVCGGAGSFLIPKAKSLGADCLVTADLKYHDFFEAEKKILLADIGHFESEQYTIDLFYDILRQNFPNFAILKTEVNTNSVRYFI